MSALRKTSNGRADRLTPEREAAIRARLDRAPGEWYVPIAPYEADTRALLRELDLMRADATAALDRKARRVAV